MLEPTCRLCLALIIAAAIPYFLPFVSAEQLNIWSTEWVDLVHLSAVVLAFSFGFRLLQHPEQRRFVGFVVGALSAWIAVRLFYLALPDLVGSRRGDLIGDFLYLTFYLGWMFAIESKPHLKAGWSKKDPAHKLQLRGAIVFVFSMLGYFVLIPSALNYEHYGTWLPSLTMFVGLDLYIAFRFWYMRGSCSAPRWRRIYALLGTVALIWAFTDSLEALNYAGKIELPAVGRSDIFWWIPYLLMIMAGRFVYRGLREEPERADGVEEKLSTAPPTIFRSIAPQVLLAFVFPAMHVLMYGFELLPPSTRGARDLLVFVTLSISGVIILRQQFVLEQRNRSLAQELTLAETQLAQARRMEAVGRLAGGIAHDFNNLLTAILGYSQLLIGRLAGQPRTQTAAEKIDRAARRAAALTKQLLAFSRRQVLQPKVIDLNAVIRGTQEMLDRLIGEKVHVVRRLQPGVTAVMADPAQLEQVIMNLVLNARDAMPDGGTLTITTEASGAATQGEAQVKLTVGDEGVGIDPADLERVFEPFFTTKALGQGTGLGLSTVYGIVTQTGGNVDIDSSPGKGTMVTVTLPRVFDVPTAISGEFRVEEKRLPTVKRTVLLVEDEATVRELTRELLEIHGYRVLEANDGMQALEVFSANESEIDFLVTDVVMPRMGGAELAKELKRQRPTLPILFVSGYSDRSDFRDGELGEGEEFLAKPFTPDELAGKLEQLLQMGATPT